MVRLFYILNFIACSVILYVPAFAQNQNDGPTITKAFELAMTWVEDNKLEAPAASRIYVLATITLHDSWHLSQGQDGYVVKTSDLESFDNNTLVEESVKTLFHCLNAERGTSSCENLTPSHSPSHTLVTHVFNKLTKPEQTDLEEALPVKHSVHPEWRRAETLELSSASMFRPNGPPPEDSPLFTFALSEVKRLGENVSEFRLSDDSLSAAFWGNPAGTITPPGHWNNIALGVIGSRPAEQQLEILLALNIALYDAGVAAWDSKYHLLYPRPHEAIRRLDPENPHWTAMGDVPLHPEYVSGHSAFSGAASAVLIAFLGEQAFCNTSKAMWGLERCFTSFTAAAEEAGQSRIYGGLHYQFSNQDGLVMGRKVAQNTLLELGRKGIIAIEP